MNAQCPPPDAVTGVDCHAHVFTRGLALAEKRRYAPDYDATIADYLAMLAANRMSHGVLIQPSFLGTDNDYLLRALRAAPGRLRGIAVLSVQAPAGLLDELDQAGVVGIRLNLIGRADPDLASPDWRSHLTAVAALGWQVEIQAEAGRLPRIVPPLLEAGVTVVIDHFGRPDHRLGTDDPGFRYLLTIGPTGRVWVKLSAAYRNGSAGQRIAEDAVPLLKAALGPDHLLWGSDWPHTQFERLATAPAARRALETWLPDPVDQRTVLVRSPMALFRLGPTAPPD